MGRLSLAAMLAVLLTGPVGAQGGPISEDEEVPAAESSSTEAPEEAAPAVQAPAAEVPPAQTTRRKSRRHSTRSRGRSRSKVSEQIRGKTRGRRSRRSRQAPVETKTMKKKAETGPSLGDQKAVPVVPLTPLSPAYI